MSLAGKLKMRIFRFSHLWRAATLRGSLALLAAPLAYSQETEPEDETSRVTFAFTLENDVFAHTDRNYTNGTHLLWDFTNAATFSEIDELPRWAQKIGRTAPLKNGDALLRGASIALGQKIYTPNDKSNSELVEDDRPYAGWTYLNLNLRSVHARSQRTLGLTIGMVGPDSFAEDVQTWVHEKIDSEIPQGWEHQLNNELGVIISYRADRLLWQTNDQPTGWNAQITQSNALTFGNVHTNAQLGAELRFGYNLTSALSSPRIRESGLGGMPTSKEDPLLRTDRKVYGLFLVIGGEGTFVARNLFVEGNTFTDSHGKKKEDWVADGYVGGTAVLGSWSLSYLYTRRSREFTEQDQYHEYGALTIAHAF